MALFLAARADSSARGDAQVTDALKKPPPKTTNADVGAQLTFTCISLPPLPQDPPSRLFSGSAFLKFESPRIWLRFGAKILFFLAIQIREP